MITEQTAAEDSLYQQRQERQYIKWEKLCQKCGACCGIVDGDPCEHLVAVASGQYTCRIYQNRFGMHKTASGRDFRCVPLRQILHHTWPGNSRCAYKRKLWNPST